MHLHIVRKILMKFAVNVLPIGVYTRADHVRGNGPPLHFCARTSTDLAYLKCSQPLIRSRAFTAISLKSIYCWYSVHSSCEFAFGVARYRFYCHRLHVFFACDQRNSCFLSFVQQINAVFLLWLFCHLFDAVAFAQ